ncbi:hypothetical protein AB1Y20_020966 [Prymnesium parvum]|uniref:AB hydrolase-1 domain-containing protein n=1 Tax=Prymnesium parvum TaxID=97485 RepID=A0AB34JK70_PRYPA
MLLLPLLRTPPPRAAARPPSVSFVNPLEVDGFGEDGGWGSHAAPSRLPLLLFLPGMDGSLTTPFMQYPELGRAFELACLCHADGLASRASFDQLADDCAAFVASQLGAGRQVLLVGESFGATLALGVLARLRAEESPLGVCLVNPATSYGRSALRRIGPSCAALPPPLYALSLLLLAALVLEPAQLPAFLALIASVRAPALLNRPEREAFLGRVALSAMLGVARGPQFAIGELLRVQIFSADDLAFRLSHWLEAGAAAVEEYLPRVDVPMLLIAGENDRLLPSVDEARRLMAMWPEKVRRGIVVVPAAGHASTLGTQLDLSAELFLAFGHELGANERGNPPSQERRPTGLATSGDDSFIWSNGLVRRTYEPLPVQEYGEWNRGGKKFPL